ncbi:type II asparaginase (plasmid) [Pantoea agglomerans]|uniref:asparaginase n=1 Tax=Enterobacter agglomerans TaxID=549 RepID=UPI0013CBE0C1|nr:asparaginase [Pantoea agglomerans]NEG64661.1 type II asparaginase [Pantoea agglomerans]
MSNNLVKHNGVRTLLLCCLLGTPGLYGITPASAETAANQTLSAHLPDVVILATGGTIAGQGSAGSYKAGTLGPEQLINAVPGLGRVARLQAEQIASIGSQDMNDGVWFKLARRITELTNRDDIQGIVITHGTDTLEETAFFLNSVIHMSKPVVLVGSMRPATAVSADGPGNLLEAVKVASTPSSVNRGVLVVMNGTVHSPVWVTKSDTTSVQTFVSPLSGPLGYVDAQELNYLHPAAGPQGPLLKLPINDTLPRVEIIYAHSNMDDLQIRHAIQDRAQGIILAGVGDGNASDAALAALKEARRNGIVVVRASRSWNGMVKRNVEIDDDAAGFVVSPGLNPQKARILTQLLIANGITSPDDVQKSFNSALQFRRIDNQH